METIELYKNCRQCPRKCGVDRSLSGVEGTSPLGFCREPADLRIAFAGLHFGEEPLITVHGGSGTSEADFKACIHNGICKINVATAIQRRIMKRIKERLAVKPDEEYVPLKQVMIDASREVVTEHIMLFESNGRFEI